MDRPKVSITNEFKVWARKRHCIKRYLHETLGMSDYGAHGFTKQRDQENHSYQNLKVYADDLLAHAILDAMELEGNPYDYCEKLFGVGTKLGVSLVTTPEEKERRSYRSPEEKAREAFDQMDDEAKQIFLDILDQSDD